MGRDRQREPLPRASAPQNRGTRPFRLTMAVPASTGSSRAEDGIRATLAEVRREIACQVCRGDIKRCRLAICPYLGRVRDWFEERRDLQTTNLFGASPPSAVVGSWGYPKVLLGPPVPPATGGGPSMLRPSETVRSS